MPGKVTDIQGVLKIYETKINKLRHFRLTVDLTLTGTQNSGLMNEVHLPEI